MNFEDISEKFLLFSLVIGALIIFVILGIFFMGITELNGNQLNALNGMGAIILVFLIWLQFKKQSEEVELLKRSVEPMIKVKTHVSLLSSGKEVSEPLISLVASNVGMLPVTLASCGIRLEGEESLTFLSAEDGLPLTLEAGKSHTIYRDIETLKQQLVGKKPRYAWFRDAVGREYTSKWYIKKVLGIKDWFHFF